MKPRLGHAVLAVAVGSLALATAAHADVRVGDNYRLNSDSSAYRGKDQLALAVNPSDPKHLVATNANYLTESCEATYSADGGVTWSPAVELEPPDPGVGSPFLPTCRISNHLGETMFQTVAFGSGQNVYAASITPRSAAFGEQSASMIVFKSIDGGRTWARGVVALAGGPGAPGPATPSSGPYYELPTIAVDPGAGTGGADRVYAVAHEANGTGNETGCPTASCPSVHAAVSNDGAQAFSAPVRVTPAGVPIAGPDSASQPVISPDHSVSVAWRTRGTTGLIQIARSTDGGTSWGAPIDVTEVTAGGRAGNSHTAVLPSTGSSFPRMAVDRASGRLYIVYGQGAPGPTPPPGGYQGADHFIAPDSHVYFQRSLDNGATWSRPKLINDNTSRPGATIVQTRHPDVSVAPNGRVDIVWQDRRHWYQGPGERNCIHTHIACDDARLGDTYYAYSIDGGATFSRDRRITDRSHNNDVGYDYRFGVGWAFGPQAVALGEDALLVGWMDSREGSFDSDNLDIYLAKVSFGAPSTVPQSKVDEPNAIALALDLAERAYPGGGEALLASTFATRNATQPVVVNEGDLPGALAGGVLGRANLGPVLLSPAAGLPAAVKAEVARLAPAGAFVIGDTGDLSGQVVTDLVAAGVDPARITRIEGGNDADTAAGMAAAMDRRTPAEAAADNPAFDAAVIANPASPDAPAAAALAAARRLPFLWVSKDAVPAETSAALTSLDIARTLVIGGTDAVGAGVLAQLPSPRRLGGADQYGTSRAVVTESLARGLPDNIVYVADGTKPMASALLGSAVGRMTGLLLLAKAPLDATAPGSAATADLDRLDRIVLVDQTPPAQPPATTPTPTPSATPAPTTGAGSPVTRCGTLRVVKRNASRSRRRVDTRVVLPCAGTLTATATTRARVNGRRRTVKLRLRIRRGTGLSRTLRVSLGSRRVRSELRRARKLTVTIVARFRPATTSAYSVPSRRTIKVVVRQPRK